MKQAEIQIEVKAFVNGKEVECELAKDAKVIINGDLLVNNVVLTPNERE